MKARPIIFSTDMVRAILAGKKTQTRRVVKTQPPIETIGCTQVWKGENHWDFWGFNGQEARRVRCPYGVAGDQLWVRETYCHKWDVFNNCRTDEYWYRATDPDVVHIDGIEKSPWLTPLFMPRAASRILLEITGIRVERVQDISEADARSEGITDGGCLSCGNPEPCECSNPKPDARESYIRLWDQINGKKHPWSDNPWVWVVEFKRIEEQP